MLLAASAPVPRDLPLSTADPDALLELAERHAVIPLLARAAGRSPTAPARILDTLSERRRHIAMENAALAARLLQVDAALRSAGVEYLAYKGPAMAVMLYGDVALRQFTDLDILLPPQDVTRALQALRSLGLAPAAGLSTRQLAHRLRFDCQVELASGPEAPHLDVHWRAVPPHLAWELPVAELLQRVQHITLGGRSIPVPSREDLLLLLCVHGAKHAWSRLQWLADVAVLLACGPPPDVEAVLQKARSTGAERMLRVGLALASELLDAPAPLSASPDAATLRLAQAAAESLLSSAAWPESRRWRYLLAVRERISDRLTCVARYAWAYVARVASGETAKPAQRPAK